ncbi:sigma-70 family RNA polymerase sigma factor [Kriegella aquimaris]|uniref:RNA polymerase sigma-70 factor, ECF subfamily n=1 Tax=Kriegella aquimaris TaxID=192904 RepID=A0A1G9Q459_9FLAO|nr:sigma-70 family RNA polymerase sigma factor [Kriegella aquimaris]SDM05531.1 RNA polymerase sigma-70 factor, ECF subfamily [Kriegella aquimaris]
MPLHQKNDADELEQLFKEHYSLLCLISFGILKDKEAAKDIVQDFFISYWQRRTTISITISFKAYAIRAVKNLSLLSLEKAKKEKSILHDLKPIVYEDPKVLGAPHSNGKVLALLNKLPESRRQIFISAILNGQSYAEIAETQGISINTVKTQMKRAYAFLRTEAAENLLRIVFWGTFVYVN